MKYIQIQIMKIRMRQQQCSFDKKSSKLVAADSRLAPQAFLHLSRAKIRRRSKYTPTSSQGVLRASTSGPPFFLQVCLTFVTASSTLKNMGDRIRWVIYLLQTNEHKKTKLQKDKKTRNKKRV